MFKNFKGRALHLSGESYAVCRFLSKYLHLYLYPNKYDVPKGRYLPLFATAIYDQNAALTEKGISPINLKSILIGKMEISIICFIYMSNRVHD